MKGMSPMMKLRAADFAKGLITAAFGAVVAALAQAVNVPGFDFATFNWNMLWQVAVTAMLGYLTKNFFTDREGTFLGSAR